MAKLVWGTACASAPNPDRVPGNAERLLRKAKMRGVLEYEGCEVRFWHDEWCGAAAGRQCNCTPVVYVMRDRIIYRLTSAGALVRARS